MHDLSEIDEDAGTGVCVICGPVKTYVRKFLVGGRHYVYTKCSTPIREAARARYHANVDGYRHARFLREYGITLEQYEAMLEQQGGVCARCKQAPGEIRLAVDHAHDTGVVRGLLCGACNTYLGRLEANLSSLDADLRYLSAEVLAQRV